MILILDQFLYLEQLWLGHSLTPKVAAKEIIAPIHNVEVGKNVNKLKMLMVVYILLRLRLGN